MKFAWFKKLVTSLFQSEPPLSVKAMERELFADFEKHFAAWEKESSGFAQIDEWSKKLDQPPALKMELMPYQKQFLKLASGDSVDALKYVSLTMKGLSAGGWGKKSYPLFKKDAKPKPKAHPVDEFDSKTRAGMKLNLVTGEYYK